MRGTASSSLYEVFAQPCERKVVPRNSVWKNSTLSLSLLSLLQGKISLVPHSWPLSCLPFTHSSRDKQWMTKVWISVFMVTWGTGLRIHDTTPATSLRVFMSRTMGCTLYYLLSTFILSCNWGTTLENVSLLFSFAFLCIPSTWGSLGPGSRGNIKVRRCASGCCLPTEVRAVVCWWGWETGRLD